MSDSRDIGGIMRELRGEDRREKLPNDFSHADFRQKGIYAIFLKERVKPPPDLAKCLEGRMKEDRLIYIGKATSKLKTRLRQHFEGASRGRSTFRKSLGALLKSKLGLVATHTSKRSNYFFADKGESDLNNWIEESLTFSYHVEKGADKVDFENTEIALVCRYQPPINIECNPNRCRHLISLREKCREEAERNKQI